MLSLFLSVEKVSGHRTHTLCMKVFDGKTNDSICRHYFHHLPHFLGESLAPGFSTIKMFMKHFLKIIKPIIHLTHVRNAPKRLVFTWFPRDIIL